MSAGLVGAFMFGNSAAALLHTARLVVSFGVYFSSDYGL